MKINGNTNSGGVRIRGSNSNDADFTLTATQGIPVIISSETTVDRTTGDLIFTTHSDATTDPTYNIVATELISGTLDNLQIQNVNPTIASLDNSGKVTRLSDGVAKIIYHTRLISKAVDCDMTRNVGATSSVFKEFASGSLAKHVNDWITARLSGQTNLFNGDPTVFGNFTRNTNFYLKDADWSCFSPWNGYQYNQMGGTLISPRHVLYNNHFVPVVGGSYGTRPIWFVAMDGTVVQRNLVSAIGDVSTDLCVVVLDEDVPSSIKFAKVLNPTDAYNKFYCLRSAGNISSARIPVVGCNQQKHATIRDWYFWYSTLYDGQSFTIPIDATKYSFYEGIIPGDSSSPCFVIINGELVCLGGWHFGGAGTCSALTNANNQAMINSWMTTLGGGYQLTSIDVSSFPTY
jgi:hypothetical protein